MQLTKKRLQIGFVIGLLLALFPWIFSYSGIIFGSRVSISSLGDVIGILIMLVGLTVLVSENFRLKMLETARQLDQLSSAEQFKIIWMMVSLYAIAAIAHKLRAHYLLKTHAFDLGFFSNICWNTAHGNWFFSSELERNFMGVHVNWILWPLSIFYRIFSGAQVLLIAQAVFVAMTLPLLWGAAWENTSSFSAGALFVLLFCASPFVGHSLSNDFHPDLWLLPCLTAALWALQRGQRSWLLCFSLFALLAKEDVSVVLCGFALMLILKKDWRLTGAALGGIALSVFVFHTQMMIPRFLERNEASLLFERYPFLGDNYKEIAHNLLFNPPVLFRVLAYEPVKYWRFACYFFPAGGLTLLAPAFLIPPLISVLPHLLSQASTQLSLADIYSMPAQPFIFVGASIGAARLINKYGARLIPWMAGGAFIVAGAGIFRAPRFFHSESGERISAFHELTSHVPAESSVSAQQSLQPHFASRRYIQLFPIRQSMPQLQRRLLLNPDYIVCDRIGNALPFDETVLKNDIEELERNSAYEKIFDKQQLLLFTRKVKEPQRWKEF